MGSAAINEIYARHGMIFGDESYSGMYENCAWYKPMYTKDEFKSSWFNQFENANHFCEDCYNNIFLEM